MNDNFKQKEFIYTKIPMTLTHPILIVNKNTLSIKGEIVYDFFSSYN